MNLFRICLFLWCVTGVVEATHSQPSIAYAVTPGKHDFIIPNRPAHFIEYGGRTGLSFRSIYGRGMLPKHNLDRDRGSVTLWVLPLQEILPFTQLPKHSLSNPYFDYFVFLGDREAVQHFEAANFAFFSRAHWHPGLNAKFYQGNEHRVLWGSPPGAMATANFFPMRSLEWYQMTVTWDKTAGTYKIFANGILVGHSDTTNPERLLTDKPGRNLFFGSPGYAMGDIAFYDEVLEGHELKKLFARQSATKPNVELAAELAKVYEGKNLPIFDFKPSEDSGWEILQKLSLTRADDFNKFLLQGASSSVQVTDEGFRIKTPGMEEYRRRLGKTHTGDQLDLTRMYLWTREIFQGDVCLTFEFKLHEEGGLALIMAQASGMQGEDFLNDYPLRSDGSMNVVHKEDVRNYHWEFYRQMLSTRNDLVSHGSYKNPWLRPLSFQIENRRWELDRWYRLTFLQEGARIRGAIDDVTVMDVTDTGFDNNGPVFRHGHLAFRAMMRTDMTIRNWEVHTRPDYRTYSN